MVRPTCVVSRKRPEAELFLCDIWCGRDWRSDETILLVEEVNHKRKGGRGTQNERVEAIKSLSVCQMWKSRRRVSAESNRRSSEVTRYESAMTRIFRHGKWETARSRTDAVEWVRSDDDISGSFLFWAALEIT
jgi:hypothetical protein